MIWFVEELEDNEDEYRSQERYYAEDQRWDKETLKQLRDEYNIVFMTNGDAVMPIKIIEENYKNKPHYMFVIGYEDDGKIWFNKHYGQYENLFDRYWTKYLIFDLNEALKICEEKERQNDKR